MPGIRLFDDLDVGELNLAGYGVFVGQRYADGKFGNREMNRAIVGTAPVLELFREWHRYGFPIFGALEAGFELMGLA